VRKRSRSMVRGSYPAAFTTALAFCANWTSGGRDDEDGADDEEGAGMLGACG
jgi:hypothetical protein